MKTFGKKQFSKISGYLIGGGLVGLATLLGRLVPFFTPTDIVMLYLLCVVIVAIVWGLGPSVLVCILGVLAHDFFFVAPYLSFGPPNIHDAPPLVVLLVVGITISYLASMVRLQTDKARHRELETHTLYLLSRNLAATDELESSIRVIMKSVKETLGYDTLLFLPVTHKNNGILKSYPEGNEHTSSENEISVATWSFQNQKKAGHGTDIFPDAKAQYLPLITIRGTVGVMAILFDNMLGQLTAEQEHLIDAFADLAAVAFERITFAEETRNMKISQAATEKLQTAFLDSISHDLRTPITSVLGVLSSLEEDFGLDDAAKKKLIQVALGEAEELNSSITNLLDISRIQAGAVNLSRQPSDVNDILSVACDELGNRYSERTIKVDAAMDLPSVLVDFSLIEKVLLNLVDNAVKYSSSDSLIEISARQGVHEVEIEVADRGVGIPPQDLPHIFHRFYRVPHHSSTPGTGLGLSICKGIIEAHGGRIAAENRQGGGTIIRLTLPIAEDIPRSQD